MIQPTFSRFHFSSSKNMELLIPGLLLVALMVYASTRIKRTAAEAFEPETIETDVFVLEKPEEFLNVINHDLALELQAYSREFGVENTADVRQACFAVRRFEGSGIEDVIGFIKDSATIKSDISEVIGERKYRIIEAERIEKGIGYREIYKLAKSGAAVFELKITALEDANDDVLRRIETILATFIVK